MTRHKTAILCILDGFAFGNEEEKSNAVFAANTPNIDYIKEKYGYVNLKSSGDAVGLPIGQMGNSEVGHMTIGAGRKIWQMLPRIDSYIADDKLKHNQFIKDAMVSDRDVHIIGLLSDGGVHSHGEHIKYLAKTLSKQGRVVHIHAISDGRDVKPDSFKEYLSKFIKDMSGAENIKISSISGRYYAMDRDNRNERTEKYYNALIGKGSEKFSNPLEYVESSYKSKITDEYIEPAVKSDFMGIGQKDIVVFANFRSDRMRQLVDSFCSPSFNGFKREVEFTPSMIICMTNYFSSIKKDFNIGVLFEDQNIKNTLPEVFSNLGIGQARIAETEKYAHVTFFFNGGKDDQLKGEDRFLIPSPKVATYDLAPEMSYKQVVEKAIECIESDKYGLIVLNIANCDMVGHSGDFDATLKAVEAVDNGIGMIMSKINDNHLFFITADHGNAECMSHVDGGINTQHTVGDVPFMLVSSSFNLNKNGSLCDIAPTILDSLSIKKPTDMDGESLLGGKKLD